MIEFFLENPVWAVLLWLIIVLWVVSEAAYAIRARIAQRRLDREIAYMSLHTPPPIPDHEFIHPPRSRDGPTVAANTQGKGQEET